MQLLDWPGPEGLEGEKWNFRRESLLRRLLDMQHNLLDNTCWPFQLQPVVSLKDTEVEKPICSETTNKPEWLFTWEQNPYFIGIISTFKVSSENKYYLQSQPKVKECFLVSCYCSQTVCKSFNNNYAPKLRCIRPPQNHSGNNILLKTSVCAD